MLLQTYQGQPLTTVYKLNPIVETDNHHILVFIPGNPGLIEFYITYLDLIQQQFPKFEIFGIGHAGYQTTDGIIESHDKDFEFFDLQYQVDHKYDILKKFILERYAQDKQPVNIYLLSHSVGSYICQRLTKRLQDCEELAGKFKLHFTGLICPAIMDLYKSDNGVKFSKLFNYLPFITLLLWLAKFLNIFLTDNTKKRIIKTKFINIPPTVDVSDPRVIDSVDNSVVGIFNIVKSARIIKQTLTLAEQELQDILTESKVNDWYFSNINNVWAYFAPYDYWVHDSTRDFLLKKYHNLEENIRFEVGSAADAITHSFCVHQSVQFAEITINRLHDFFPDGI